MLDLNHPQTEHIFRASGLLGALLKCSQRMSVAPSVLRAELLAHANSRIEELRSLGTERFAKSTAIRPALDQLATAFADLAAKGGGELTDDATGGDGPCPACGGDVMKFDAMATIRGQSPQWIMLCRDCIEPFSEPFRKLESGDSFCTMFI